MGDLFEPWLTTEPAITPRIGSPLSIASCNGRRTTSPAPSPRQYPSAETSNDLHAPVDDRKEAAARFWYTLGFVRIFTPPATAIEHSFVCRAYHLYISQPLHFQIGQWESHIVPCMPYG